MALLIHLSFYFCWIQLRQHLVWWPFPLSSAKNNGQDSSYTLSSNLCLLGKKKHTTVKGAANAGLPHPEPQKPGTRGSSGFSNIYSLIAWDSAWDGKQDRVLLGPGTCHCIHIYTRTNTQNKKTNRWAASDVSRACISSTTTTLLQSRLQRCMLSLAWKDSLRTGEGGAYERPQTQHLYPPPGCWALLCSMTLWLYFRASSSLLMSCIPPHVTDIWLALGSFRLPYAPHWAGAFDLACTAANHTKKFPSIPHTYIQWALPGMQPAVLRKEHFNGILLL